MILNIGLKVLFYIICFLFMATPVSSQIVENIEVKGKIFSREMNSKNMVIISESDLYALKIKDFTELFSFFNVVNVSRRGPGESSFDLSMRGSNFEQVLVLVNGIPLNNPQTGHFNTDLPFLIKDIERIEIVRGGGSTTYGGGAFAGLVNIILKKKNAVNFSVTSGENKYFASTIHVGQRFKKVDFKLSAHRSNSSGYHKGREFDLIKLSGGAFYSSGDLTVEFFTGFLNKDFGAHGFYAPFPSVEEIKSFFYLCQVKKKIKKFNYVLTYSYHSHNDHFILDRMNPHYFGSESQTKINYLNFLGSYGTGKIKATGGIEFKGEIMDSSAMGFHKRNRGAVFLNLNCFFKQWGVDTGIRGDIIAGGKSDITFYTGIHRSISPHLVFKAGYGKTFRVPSFTELYYQSPANIGEPDLKSEVSQNYEISISKLTQKHHLDLSIFYRNQDNLIDWVKVADESPWHACNIKKNDVLGFEISHRFHLNRTTFISGIEKIFVVNKGEGFISKYGLRFPDFSVKMNLSHRITTVFSFVASYCYKRIYRTEERGHFLNLRLYFIFKHLEVGLRCDNFLNTVIEEIPGVTIPGRWIYITLSYK